MELQRSSSISMTFNQNTAFVSRSDSQTLLLGAFEDCMEFIDLNHELFQPPAVRSSNSGGGGGGLIQSFVATGWPHLMTHVIQTPGGSQLNNNIYAVPADIASYCDANNKNIPKG
ncbi:uncharacterized protein LOC122817789 [Drosophila biarmipes]|uniref:uncharacterized protein LOC122817789 n=1 Tax=Drosophila biarmipes TaxID=125945 RepID=UPI001CDB1009|nr:uncharacterized protein LOC122817789 [Drosophila biarmipes]